MSGYGFALCLSYPRIDVLRHDRLDAPWVISGAMNGEMFDLYVASQLVPTLRQGDVVILDNLSNCKSPSAARALRDVGAWFLFLPPYSPDLNPIEMAFSKLKTLIRKASARIYDQLWQAVGHVCGLSLWRDWAPRTKFPAACQTLTRNYQFAPDTVSFQTFLKSEKMRLTHKFGI